MEKTLEKVLEEALEYARVCREIKAFTGGEQKDPLKVAAEYLHTNGVTVQKWIPVSKRMPEDFVSVLVHIPDDSPLPTVKEAYHAGGLWITRCCMCNDADITHWMPLPKPPQEV